MFFGYVFAFLLASASANDTAGCALCTRPDVTAAGTLNEEDFASFCSSCKAAKEAVKGMPSDIKKDDSKIADAGGQGVSPSACKVCQRPDVQGLTAGDLRNVDYSGFCSTCKNTYGNALALINLLSENSGCALCGRKDVLTPNTLNCDDFHSFCETCPSAEDEVKVKGPETVKKDDKKIMRTKKSPAECKVCERPDVSGYAANDLNSGDFQGFCAACANTYGTVVNLAAAPAFAAASRAPDEARAFMFGFLSCGVLAGAYFRYTRRISSQAEPFLQGYSEF